MATYYATTNIPTGQDVNSFDVTLTWNNNITTVSITDLTDISSLEAVFEGYLGGEFTYNLIPTNTGTQIKLIWATPTIQPVNVLFLDTIAGDYYPFNFNEIESCTGCGSVQWAECEEDYTIDLGLTPSTLYNYTLTHGQTGIEYTQNSTTDGSGVTTWDTYLMPELYVSGNVFVLTATNGAEDVTFTYNGTEYSCMQITIVKQTNITD